MNSSAIDHINPTHIGSNIKIITTVNVPKVLETDVKLSEYK